MESKSLIQEITIPLYLRQYIKSNSIRAKYYENGGKNKIPERIGKNPDLYAWREFAVTIKGKKKKKEYLVHKATGTRVIANEFNAGKVNKVNINGQGIYNGNIAQFDRNNMIRQIKESFHDAVKSIKVITEFPIRIDVYLFDTVIDDDFNQGQEWDLDNRFFPYAKSIPDLMKKLNKIPDDNILYITEPPHPIFVPVPDPEDRKLVVRIFKDTREIIKNNYFYKQKHGR